MLTDAVQTLPDPALDRRASIRFPIDAEICYRVLEPKELPAGKGRTLDISSRGVRFSCQNRLGAYELLELSVNWPAQLDGHCLLKLVAVGRVVRSADKWAAIRIEKYEFRTRRVHDLPVAPIRTSTWQG